MAPKTDLPAFLYHYQVFPPHLTHKILQMWFHYYKREKERSIVAIVCGVFWTIIWGKCDFRNSYSKCMQEENSRKKTPFLFPGARFLLLSFGVNKTYILLKHFLFCYPPFLFWIHFGKI